MALTLLAYMMMFIGGLITVLFWVPRLVNRRQLRDLFGRRYPLVYLFYFTNGPFLLLVGLYLFWFQGR